MNGSWKATWTRVGATALLATGFGTAALAAPATTSSGTSSSTAAPTSSAPAAGVPVGTLSTVPGTPTTPLNVRLELRPTYLNGSDSFRAYNNVELNYSFSRQKKLLGVVNFDMYSPTNDSVMKASLPDSRVEFDWNDFWADGRWAVEFQPRAHLPVDPAKRDAGMITELRPQFNLNHRVSRDVAATLAFAPSAHWYRSAATTAPGKLTANPLFDYRLEAVAKYQIAQNLRFEFPVRWWATRYQVMAAAAKSGETAHMLTLKPELQYQLTRQVVLGVALETASFVQSDFRRLTTNSAFKNVQAQALVAATL